MQAERGAQTEEDLRASLRMIPGLLRIWGAEDPDDENEDDPDEDENEDDPDEDEDDPDDDESDEDKAKAKKKKSKEPTLEEQLDEEKRLRLKAERKLKLKEKAAEDAEGDKDAAKELTKVQAKLEARDKFLADNLLAIEISKQDKYKFVDVEDVVNLIQKKYSDDVIIDLESDVPEIEGLDLALKKIAKDKPHFLQKDSDDDDDDDGGTKRSSGSRMRKGKKESAEAEEKRLGEKFKIPGYGTHGLSRVM